VLSYLRQWQWVRECEKWLMRPIPVIIIERHAGEEIAQCVDCHSLLKVRYHLKLIVHLRVDHKLSEDASIETVTWIMDRVYRTRMENARLARETGKL
jgi:hypothetical protein